ncbi:N-acetylneuraminate synthase [Thermodesulfobacteriota bacterium]
MKLVQVANRLVGGDHPCFIIAEAGVNHNGEAEMAKKLIDVAVTAKADAVKFQSFDVDQLVTRSAPKARYQLEATGGDESQYRMLETLELTQSEQRELCSYAGDKGIIFMSTPFDEASADFLDELDVPAFKIGSGELTNLPFLSHVASKNRPMIVSTGMATLGEVETAVHTITEAGNERIVLLHCVTSYPAAPEDQNLRAMAIIEAAFGFPVGFSDHTEGIEIAPAAVALGASLIEKHFTLDRNLPGPDHGASIEPAELVKLVSGIRNVQSALGCGTKRPADKELEIAGVVRRSIVAATDIVAGTTLTREHLVLRRPGTGLPPVFLSCVLGRRLRGNVQAGHLIGWEDLA